MFRNKFIKHVLTLMKGTTMAQLIPIMISPILTRLYTPEQFGLFSIYIAVISVLSPIVNGRYELAILLPDENRKSLMLFLLSLIINIFVTVLSIVILFLFFSLDGMELFGESKREWIYFLPVGIFLVGLYSSLTYLNNRWQRFNHLANAKINQSLSMGVIQLLLGFAKFSYLGLIIGYFIGQILSIFQLRKDANLYINIKNENFKKENIKSIASEYKEFPKYAMVTHSTESLSTNIPNILLNKFFGARYTGYYSLTTRTISLPLSLIGKSVGDVFLSTASKLYREKGECEDLYKKTFKVLALLPIIPFSVLFVYSEELFTFVFGENWTIAGQYTKILIPALYLQFISSPLSHMFIIAKKVKIEFFVQILILMLSIGAFFVGNYYFKSDLASIYMFSGVLILKYFIFIGLSYKFSKKII